MSRTWVLLAAAALLASCASAAAPHRAAFPGASDIVVEGVNVRVTGGGFRFQLPDRDWTVAYGKGGPVGRALRIIDHRHNVMVQISSRPLESSFTVTVGTVLDDVRSSGASMPPGGLHYETVHGGMRAMTPCRRGSPDGDTEDGRVYVIAHDGSPRVIVVEGWAPETPFGNDTDAVRSIADSVRPL